MTNENVNSIVFVQEQLQDDFEYAISQQVVILAKAGYISHTFSPQAGVVVVQYAVANDIGGPYSYWLSLDEATKIDELRAKEEGIEVTADA